MDSLSSYTEPAREDGLGLGGFFRPRSVAVVGASRKAGSPGYNMVRNVLETGVGLAVYPINPSAEEILGVKCYPDISAIPDEVDLAVILVPAAMVVDVMRECAAKGVRNVLVISSGFAELGGRGAELQNEFSGIARSNGIRVLGPNCLGLCNVTDRLNITISESLRRMWPAVRPGNIAFVSQSGAFGVAFFISAMEKGIRFSKFCSIGNKADLDEVDLLRFLEGDSSTSTIMMYIEDIRRGRLFVETASRVTKSKPIVIAKIGRSVAGKRAVASHTGALAGTDKAYDAAFRKAGIIRAPSSHEMVGFAKALSMQPPLRGPRIGIVTNSGGISAELVDACEDRGLQVPELPSGTRTKLGEIVPPFCSTRNPIDLAAPDPRQSSWYIETASVLLESEDIDGVVLVMIGLGLSLAGPEIAARAHELRRHGKPIMALALSDSQVLNEMRIRLEDASIPVYEEAWTVAGCMSALLKYGEYLSK